MRGGDRVRAVAGSSGRMWSGKGREAVRRTLRGRYGMSLMTSLTSMISTKSTKRMLE